jgi:hypothetical protein
MPRASRRKIREEPAQAEPDDADPALGARQAQRGLDRSLDIADAGMRRRYPELKMDADQLSAWWGCPRRSIDAGFSDEVSPLLVSELLEGEGVDGLRELPGEAGLVTPCIVGLAGESGDRIDASIRKLRHGAQATTDLVAIELGHRDIEEDELRAIFVRRLHGVFAIPCDVHLMPRPLEEDGQGLDAVGLIVCNQDRPAVQAGQAALLGSYQPSLSAFSPG